MHIQPRGRLSTFFGRVVPRIALIGVVSMALLLASGAAVAQDSSAGLPPEVEDKLMYSLGGSLAIQCFVSALMVGELAEEVQAGESGVLVRVGGVRGGLESVTQQLDSLMAQDGFPESERKIITQMRDISANLAKQLEYIDDWSRTRDKDSARKFRELRESTWKSTVEVLGLDANIAKELAPDGADFGK